MVGELFLGDDMLRISAADLGEERVAVERAGLGARTGLDVVRHASCGCEAPLAERASDVVATMFAAVHMLGFFSFERGSERNRHTHLTQIVLVLEALVTRLATVVHPVVLLLHVGLCLGTRIEGPRAALALENLRPMIILVHVIANLTQGIELGGAHPALVVVASSIHMLPTCLPVDERASTDTTFWVHCD